MNQARTPAHARPVCVDIDHPERRQIAGACPIKSGEVRRAPTGRLILAGTYTVSNLARVEAIMRTTLSALLLSLAPVPVMAAENEPSAATPQRRGRC